MRTKEEIQKDLKRFDKNLSDGMRPEFASALYLGVIAELLLDLRENQVDEVQILSISQNSILQAIQDRRLQ